MSISLGSYANGCVGQPSYANLTGLIARAAVRRLTVAEQRAVTGTARRRALDGVWLGRRALRVQRLRVLILEFEKRRRAAPLFYNRRMVARRTEASWHGCVEAGASGL